MENYSVLSMETHLFFARIMKEHALFLEAGFVCKDTTWRRRADWFRREFEELLRQTLLLGRGFISEPVVHSQELVTDFTIPAERRTENLTGIPINSRISAMERNVRETRNFGRCQRKENCEMRRQISRLNKRGIRLLDGLIDFKERILSEVGSCRLFTANYPLLIEHILREARLYRQTLMELEEGRTLSYQKMYETERFWNQIMMEHALFIRGLLDPTEEALIHTADDFAMDYKKLLQMAREQDWKAMEDIRSKSLEETLKYRKFKTAGAEGILGCKISSIILPLLADHVLREANHYIRLLECSKKSWNFGGQVNGIM